MTLEYNSQRPQIILKEYGRNVQKLVDYIRTVEPKEKRTELAYAIIELIKKLNPTVRESVENPQRLWDDLLIIADFELDVNNPFLPPEKDILSKKPMAVNYPQSKIQYKHYGKNIELLLKEAVTREEPQKKEEAVIYIGRLMKTFHGSWNKEILDDSVILKDIEMLSGGKLTMSLDKIREENLFERLYVEKKNSHRSGQRSGPRKGNGKSFKRFSSYKKRDK